MKINLYYYDGTVKTRNAFVKEYEEYDEVTILPEEIGRNVQYAEIDPEYFVAEVGDEGYMLSSTTIALNTALLYFNEKEDFVFDRAYGRGANVMPIMGIRRNANAWFAIATGMSLAFYPHYVKEGNTYKMTAKFIIEGDVPYEAIKMHFYKIPNGTYNEMAHIYRDWQIEHEGLKPLRERAIENPVLSYAAESVELRIRMGWKPMPTPMPHQTPDNQPPLSVYMDFDSIVEAIDRMKQSGIEKAELCLVGWNIGGHDGCFPQLFPADERFGGDEKLKYVIDYAKKNGYMIVCHDNYTAAYECAECWDEEYVAKTKEGSIEFKGILPTMSSGVAYRMCPQRAYERFATTRLPEMRDRGFYGLHYVDVFSARPPIRCYDEKHPVSFADCRDYYLKIMNMSRELIGGFQSEGPHDFVASALDYCLYTSRASNLHKDDNFIICDEIVPFWEIVYHGYILSSPNASSVNYTIKGKEQELYMIECGGRPVMYYYSKFGATMNWMGDIDLLFGTEEEKNKSIEAIRKAYEYAEKYKSLQYETMEKHEKLSEGVYRTTFSDNTVVTVDYNEVSYNVEWGTK